jgi:hypothetical protein
MPNPITISRTITIYDPSGNQFTTGTLTIIVTPGNPATVSGSFTPAQTTTPPTSLSLIPNLLNWTSTASGRVTFSFNVSSQVGSFPPGSYTFTGTQQANGDPKGTVPWPSATQSEKIGPEGDETDTWQASGGGGGGEDEPSVIHGRAN